MHQNSSSDESDKIFLSHVLGQRVCGFTEDGLPLFRDSRERELPEYSKTTKKCLSPSDVQYKLSRFLSILSRVLDECNKDEKLGFDDEEVETNTSTSQIKTEKLIQDELKSCQKMIELDPEFPHLSAEKYRDYLNSSVKLIYSEAQDSCRVWMVYWCVHSLALLKQELEPYWKKKIIEFLDNCQDKEGGGFGGGPLQYAHLAPTYAAVNAICSLDFEEGYRIIDRVKLKEFLYSLKQEDGSFRVHRGGEADLRGVYCALTVAMLTNVYDNELFRNSIEWILRCQTYEGGFGAVPHAEAHGGYSFCAVAALKSLDRLHLSDIPSVLRWTIKRQMRLEGGFQGRTNKLVDSCYSFWQGAALVILQEHMTKEKTPIQKEWWFDSWTLQMYVILCCQDPEGGISDKPSVRKDPYHTCYALSGVSLCQHLPRGEASTLGSNIPILAKTDPVYNIEVEKLQRATNFFKVTDF